MPRPKQRTPELRDRILDVAVDAVASDGVAELTTRTIAAAAGTSVPAVYELFGDKEGLVRAVFFEGFRRLGQQLAALGTSDDPRADLVAVLDALRSFGRDNRQLARLMFSRPLAAFEAGPDDVEAAAAVRKLIVGRVRRCVDAGVLAGNDTDIAHVLLAVVQGLAAQEAAGWLGTSRASRDRRWDLAFDAVLDGLRPAGRARRAPAAGSPSPRRRTARGSGR